MFLFVFFFIIVLLETGIYWLCVTDLIAQDIERLIYLNVTVEAVAFFFMHIKLDFGIFGYT